MLIQVGEKVHVITRRLFDNDVRRHFVGVVTGADSCALRLSGYAFIFDETENDFVRLDERRERVISLTDAGLVINILPGGTNLETVRYTADSRGRHIVTDGESFNLNINEFGLNR
jgi:hypothetical protein